MTFKEELIIAITKELVASGRGIDINPKSAIPQDAATAILRLANAIEKEASKEN